MVARVGSENLETQFWEKRGILEGGRWGFGGGGGGGGGDDDCRQLHC